MDADHIFIFTDDNGKTADQLVEFGLTEGSNRVHVGQGTTNRKFYFDNFFLEILWVHDTNEIESEKIKPIGLWQRAEFKINNFSPFGLCIINTSETDELFENAFKYQPDYFPQGQTIDILKNENQSSLPWTFRLPIKGQKKNNNEPTKHKNGIGLLTKTTFEHQESIKAKFINFFEREQNIEFIKSDRTWLNLTFDNGKQGLATEFLTLKLTIHY
ncbi:VOC family protein [Fibrella aquatilis]|uniref:VOC family protein n=1 Tax=Fibrella aquatilis TaxID=2817059 RepID=A0A939K0W4_9BACT|nr:VOC family protein [Fibrella aquatilis]MBO0932426.1 VOC family protein [Fibrella aquatilis]